MIRVTVKMCKMLSFRTTKQTTSVDSSGEFAMRRGSITLAHLLFPSPHRNHLETVTASWSHLFHTSPTRSHTHLSSIPKVGPEQSKTMLFPLLYHCDWSEKWMQVLRGPTQKEEWKSCLRALQRDGTSFS